MERQILLNWFREWQKDNKHIHLGSSIGEYERILIEDLLITLYNFVADAQISC